MFIYYTQAETADKILTTPTRIKFIWANCNQLFRCNIRGKERPVYCLRSEYGQRNKYNLNKIVWMHVCMYILMYNTYICVPQVQPNALNVDVYRVPWIIFALITNSIVKVCWFMRLGNICVDYANTALIMYYTLPIYLYIPIYIDNKMKYIFFLGYSIQINKVKPSF